MPRLVVSTCLAVPLIPLLIGEITPLRTPVGQTPANSIRNFRAANISSAELRVTVDYTFTGGAAVEEVSIFANPEEAGGASDPRTVEVDELPVQTGSHTVTLTITKREGARDFTSVSVQVCLSTADRALLCQSFPYQKTWTAAVPPKPKPGEVAPVPPPPAPAQETCTISGRITGPLKGWVSPDTPGEKGYEATLKNVALAVGVGTRPVLTPIKNRTYTFKNVPAGVVYRISLEGFHSEPQYKTVSCRAGKHYPSRNFKSLGAAGMA